MGKRCGNCTACCNGVLDFKVNDLQVGGGIPCPHMSCKGCAVYETRPPVCRDFSCRWLLDEAMPIWMRPDKSGVVITANTEDSLLWEGSLVDCAVPTADKIPAKTLKYLAKRADTLKKPFKFFERVGDLVSVGAVGPPAFVDFVAAQPGGLDG